MPPADTMGIPHNVVRTFFDKVKKGDVDEVMRAVQEMGFNVATMFDEQAFK
jgi:GTP-binding protein EngB required for normal cell division